MPTFGKIYQIIFVSLTALIYISANGDSYTYMIVPTFTSESNSATLRFTSNYDQTLSGILIIFVSLTALIYISANGDSYTYMIVPTFTSESNSATLRFTSNYDQTLSGILMAYVSSKNLHLT